MRRCGGGGGTHQCDDGHLYQPDGGAGLIVIIRAKTIVFIANLSSLMQIPHA